MRVRRLVAVRVYWPGFLAMQKVVGSSPIIRSSRKAPETGSFSVAGGFEPAPCAADDRVAHRDESLTR